MSVDFLTEDKKGWLKQTYKAAYHLNLNLSYFLNFPGLGSRASLHSKASEYILMCDIIFLYI